MGQGSPQDGLLHHGPPYYSPLTPPWLCSSQPTARASGGAGGAWGPHTYPTAKGNIYSVLKRAGPGSQGWVTLGIPPALGTRVGTAGSQPELALWGGRRRIKYLLPLPQHPLVHSKQRGSICLDLLLGGSDTEQGRTELWGCPQPPKQPLRNPPLPGQDSISQSPLPKKNKSLLTQVPAPSTASPELGRGFAARLPAQRRFI